MIRGLTVAGNSISEDYRSSNHDRKIVTDVVVESSVVILPSLSDRRDTDKGSTRASWYRQTRFDFSRTEQEDETEIGAVQSVSLRLGEAEQDAIGHEQRQGWAPDIAVNADRFSGMHVECCSAN